MAQMIYTWLRHALSISNPHNLYAPIPQSHPYLSPSSHYSRNGSIDSTTSTLRPDTEKASSPTRSRKWLSPRVLADATIGLSDGLTVPFALTAGLSALGDTKVVIYGGFAELFAGAISMGVGGYLGARGECQAYNAALSTTQRDVAAESKRVDEQIHMSLAEYGLSASTLAAVTAELKSSPDALESFLMKFHHEQSDEVASGVRAYVSGLTIALGYFLGGLLPLLPYLFCGNMKTAFWLSCGVMVNVLFMFGSVKTWMIQGQSKRGCFWSGVQMVVLGGMAAGAAMACVTTIGGGEG